MGFSVTASVVILALGGFAVAGTFAGAFLTSYDDVSGAAREEWASLSAQAHTNISVTSETYNAGTTTLTLNLRNAGATVLDPKKLEFVVDGAWKTNKVTSLTVKGASTAVWAPGDTLVAVLTDAGWAGAPKCIAVATGNGVATYWRSGC